VERSPVDGVVIDGSSTVNESVAIGESIPDEKTEGDEVIGGVSTKRERCSSR
jgi:cation transport ATPase